MSVTVIKFLKKVIKSANSNLFNTTKFILLDSLLYEVFLGGGVFVKELILTTKGHFGHKVLKGSLVRQKIDMLYMCIP